MLVYGDVQISDTTDASWVHLVIILVIAQPELVHVHPDDQMVAPGLSLES